MSSLQKVVYMSKGYLKRNSSTILTGIGAAGVVGTAAMTAKATTKASKLLEEAKTIKGENLTKLEKVNVALPAYLPTILLGTATITCIIGANIINKRHQASLIGAYAMLDRSYKEYRLNVEELYGDGSNDEIEEEIARDKYKEVYIRPEKGKELFYDVYSKRYFESTMEDVLRAETEINRIMTTGYGASLNEFYELLGLAGIDEYSELGWSPWMMEEMYWHAWIEFDHRKVTMDDGNECYILTIPLEPFVDYLD